MKNTSATLTCW